MEFVTPWPLRGAKWRSPNVLQECRDGDFGEVSSHFYRERRILCGVWYCGHAGWLKTIPSLIVAV